VKTLIEYHNLSMPLRFALIGNAAFSLMTGLTMAVCAEDLTWVLGLREAATLKTVGCVLAVYSVLLAFNAWRKQPRRGEAWAAVMLDFGWVIGSASLIVDDQFSAAGDWLVALAAIAVFVFAVLQVLGLHALACHRRAVPDDTGHTLPAEGEHAR
jgi:hypothetical protein